MSRSAQQQLMSIVSVIQRSFLSELRLMRLQYRAEGL